jgi:hypothetical protein
MAHNEHHEHLMAEIAEIFQPILSDSPQAIYIYLDDEHKLCNAKFADMLGYKSGDEWVANLYPVEDLDEKDQKKGIEAYMNASGKLMASSLDAAWTKKDGKKIKTRIIMTPFVYEDEVFVIHFITPLK